MNLEATHININEAEQLARELRVNSGGSLTLAVVPNEPGGARTHRTLNWGEAKEHAAALVAEADEEQVGRRVPMTAERRAQLGLPEPVVLPRAHVTIPQADQ